MSVHSGRMAWGLLLGLLAALCWQHAAAYYVPGTYPQEFRMGDSLTAHVSSLSSFETELPYEYYTMPFCKPAEGVKRVANTANPGTLLQGLRIETSPYNFTMKVPQKTQLVCQPNGYYGPLTKDEVSNLKHKINKKYRINMLLDNLPITVYDLEKEQEYVRPGFELGYSKDGKYYINNHLVFNILVYQTHGEYTEASKNAQNLAAVEAMENLRLRKLASSSSSSGSETSRRLGRGQVLGGGPVTGALRQLLQQKSSVPLDSEAPFYMVVGFEVSPCSIQRDAGKLPPDDVQCPMDDEQATKVVAQEIKEGAKIVYTYDVWWSDSKIKWASRWDAYLRMPGGKVHWFSIMNSLLVVLVMASIVALILIRTVRKDLAKYEQLVMDSNSNAADLKDEAGWKLLTGDAFRAPPSAMGLATQVGSGVQIICTATVTIFLATLGFLSPAARGALITTTLVLYVWLALVAGLSGVYVWGAMERTYAGWYQVCLRVATFYPGILLGIFTLLNLVIRHTGSTGAIPIGMFFSMMAVWFVVSIPLTFVGGYVALKLPIRENPVKTNQIPRHVPPPPLGAHPWLLFFAAGILPFGTIFIELYFAMTSLWLGYFYYLFGFVFLIGLLAVIINAEISVLCTYVQLCAEDYQWWWASFRRGGSVAVYITLYALGFMLSSLGSMAGFIPCFIYLCYMSVLILGVYFSMGTVGFIASWLFVHAIFGAVKAD